VSFNCFMADVENGRNLKLMRLTDAEYRAFMGGVLPIAAKAEVRGTFTVGRTPATAEDVCNQSPKTSKRAAESLLRKMREMGMLDTDDALGVEWVHDFGELNPEPKRDRSNAARQAKWRARNAARNAVTPPSVTPPEVEGEEEVEVTDVSTTANVVALPRGVETSEGSSADAWGVAP